MVATVTKRLKQAQKNITRERETWERKEELMTQEIEQCNDRVYLSKIRSRELIAEQVSKAKTSESHLRNYIDELTEEKGQALQDLLDTKGKCERERRLSEQRKVKWHNERELRRQAENEAVSERNRFLELEKVVKKYKEVDSPTRRRMKREWCNATVARAHGGRTAWPAWVVQLICELLVNGTTPTAIPGNIKVMYSTLFGEDVTPPSVNFCRECRTIVQVCGETIAAIKLAQAPTWEQLWTDATTRRQIPFTALIIGLMGAGPDDKLDPIVVSSCIFMDDECSETCAAGIIAKVRSLTCQSNAVMLTNMQTG